MTIATLHKVTPGRSNYYTITIAKDDYYTAHGESSGHWYGNGAKALGIEGEAIGFKDEGYQRLINGFHPTNDAQLRRVELTPRTYKGKDGEKQTSHPVVGFDFTLSAPKSLSVIYATCSSEMRHAIDLSLQAATEKAISYIEENLCHTRSGRGGKVRDIGKPVFAAFNHTTSRSLDPQLHTHVVLINSAERPDGTWGALDASDFLSKGKTKEVLQTIAAIHANELRYQLETRIGLQTVSSEYNQTFHINGVPLELQIEMSKRGRVIESRIKEEFTDHGLEPNVQDKQRIVLETREKKRNITFEERLNYWQDAAREFGFNPEKLPKNKRPPEKVRHWQELTDRVSAELHRQDATITQRKILLEATKHSGGRFQTDDLIYFAQGYQEHYTKSIELKGESKCVLDKNGIKAVRDYWMKQAHGSSPDLSQLGAHDRSMLGKALDKIAELRKVRRDYIRDRRRRQLERLKRQAPLLYIMGRIDLKTYKALTRKPPKSKAAIEVLYATHQISSAQRKYYQALLDEEQKKLENKKRVDRLMRAESLYMAGEIDRQTRDDVRVGNFWEGSRKEGKRSERDLSYIDQLLNREKENTSPEAPAPGFLDKVLNKLTGQEKQQTSKSPPKKVPREEQRRARDLNRDR
jgi:conjugative relaxase-like TrwC/TraI family protein